MSQFNDNATFSFAAAQTWPNLRVTFGLNPFGSAFYPYPLTAQEASDAGWQLISSCGDTDPTWLGNRFNNYNRILTGFSSYTNAISQLFYFLLQST